MHVGSIQFRALGLIGTGAICSLVACSGGGGSVATSNSSPSTPVVLVTPTINAPATASVGGTSLNANIAAPQPSATYTWSIIGGSFVGSNSGTSVSFTADQPGTLTLTCNAALGNQSQSATADLLVQSAQPLVPQIAAITSTTSGATGLKAGVSQPEVGTTYSWTILNGTITAGGNSPQVTFTAGSQGVLTLTCTGTNAVGSSSSQVSLQVGPASSNASVFTVPNSIDGTGTIDVTAALNIWIGTVPDGNASIPSVIKFPAGNIYLLSQGIQFKDRSYLIFDGYGAKLKLNTAAGFGQLQSLFLLGRNYGGYWSGINKNITIKGFELEASNPTPGMWSSAREMAHAIEIDNSDTVKIFDVLAHGIGGDGFKIGDSTNIKIHNNHVQDAGRQGVSIISGDQILIENNQFDDMGYYILDIEPNLDTESATNIIFRNNTAGSWGPNLGVGAGFVACGSGTAYNQIGNITITGNSINGKSDASLLSFFNQNQYKRLYNITFTNNRAVQTAMGPVLIFKAIDGLTVTGNTQPLGSGSLYSIISCTVVVSSPNP